MTDLSYRIATLKDTSQIVELVNSAYRGDSSRRGWTTEADLLDGQRADLDLIREAMKSPDHVILLCFQKENLIGSVALERQGLNCYLGMFTVRPNHQNMGFGKKFMKVAEDYALTEFKSDTMTISVISQRTELIAWYERRGFGKTGTTVVFPYGNERFGIPKRDDLFMIEMKKKL